MRVVFVPSTLALLPSYASIEDPIVDLRKVVEEAVAWLGQARVLGDSRIGAELLGVRLGEGPGLLVVANGTATRTEKAPGHLDERAADFDAHLGAALASGDLTTLRQIDLDLARELWAYDVDALATAANEVHEVTDVQVDYDDAPYGVQYWVVRWQCAS